MPSMNLLVACLPLACRCPVWVSALRSLLFQLLDHVSSRCLHQCQDATLRQTQMGHAYEMQLVLWLTGTTVLSETSECVSPQREYLGEVSRVAFFPTMSTSTHVSFPTASFAARICASVYGRNGPYMTLSCDLSPSPHVPGEIFLWSNLAPRLCSQLSRADARTCCSRLPRLP